tara:strand:+ start:206 stop:571 length:366 start_codon:yes stop_codon:yes gene_type:complete
VATAWELSAKDSTFGGLTLDEYKAQIAKCEAKRETLAQVEALRSSGIKERMLEDESLNETTYRVVDGVKCAPTHGRNSPLYRAMGYVPYDERSSGLTRKRAESTPEDNGTANGETELTVNE